MLLGKNDNADLKIKYIAPFFFFLHDSCLKHFTLTFNKNLVYSLSTLACYILPFL